MNFLRKLALVLITPIFTFILFLTALDMGIVRTVSQPANVKKVLADSGIYNTAVNSLLDQAKNESTDSGSINLNDPAIRSAANSAITPQYLQTQTESVINSVYDWLNGKSTQPNFSINVTDIKGRFATAVGAAVQQRAASLPVCTDPTTINNYDPVSASCVPPNVTPAAAGSLAEGNIISGKGFLDNPTITADSIKSGNSQKSIFSDKLQSAPDRYQKAKKSPIALAILALLLALAIIFLSSSRLQGLRHVGVVLLVIGLFMLLFAWGTHEAVVKQSPKIKLNNAVLQADVRKLATDVVQQLDQNYYLFGGIYVVLGALAIASAYYWGRDAKATSTKKQDKDDKEDEGKNAEDRIDLHEPDKVADWDQSKPKKKPAKKTIKVE